jgi:HD-like signal output (HDOD) protein
MQIEALLQRLDKGGYPSPSRSTLALTELLQQDNAGIADAAKLIRVDPILTAKIIKIANSAIYGKYRRIMGIEEALMRIGLKMVVPLALGLTLATKTFSTPPNFDLRRFWAGSLLRAIAMHALAARTDEWPAADVFTVGLLCEIGSLFMACSAPAETAALASQNLPVAALLDQEKAHFGFDHRQLSAALLRHWRVPENIVLALESQRNIADATSSAERTGRLHTLRAIIDGRPEYCQLGAHRCSRPIHDAASKCSKKLVVS